MFAADWFMVRNSKYIKGLRTFICSHIRLLLSAWSYYIHTVGGHEKKKRIKRLINKISNFSFKLSHFIFKYGENKFVFFCQKWRKVNVPEYISKNFIPG